MQPRATLEDYERALAGLQYPVSKPAVIRNARDHGGIDTEVADTLERLPEVSFDSFTELLDAIRVLYNELPREAVDPPVAPI
jgi:hypothetical protein